MVRRAVVAAACVLLAAVAWRSEWLLGCALDLPGHCCAVAVKDSTVVLCRRDDGVVHADVSGGTAVGDVAVARALGYTHARDRWTQMMMSRVLFRGRSAVIQDVEANYDRDVFMRGLGLFRDAELFAGVAPPHRLAQVQAYADGVNAYTASMWTRPLDAMLLRLPADDQWQVADSLLLFSAAVYLGLADIAHTSEKLLFQMASQAHQPRAWDLLRSLLHPHLENTTLYNHRQYVGAAARVAQLFPVVRRGAVLAAATPSAVSGSNCWAVSGQHTASGKPLLACDPHLWTNHLPSLLYPVAVSFPLADGSRNGWAGATSPGMHQPLLARSQHVAFGVTNAFLDQADYFIEEVNHNGSYRVEGGEWLPLHRIHDTVVRGRRGDVVRLTFWATRHGVLELRDATLTTPPPAGMYLVRNMLSSEVLAAAVEAMQVDGVPDTVNPAVVAAATSWLDMHWPTTDARTADEAAARLAQISLGLHWVVVDTAGGVRYQQSGLLAKRQPGVTGLLPRLGWEADHRHHGAVLHTDLPFTDVGVDGPGVGSPLPGVVVSANNPVPMPRVPGRMYNWNPGADRVNRINALLEPLVRNGTRLTGRHFAAMQRDVVSTQVCEVMGVLRPLLPHRPASARLLAAWDCSFTADSQAATVFSLVYRQVLRDVLSPLLDPAATDAVWAATMPFSSRLLADVVLGRRNASLWFGDRGRDAVLANSVRMFFASDTTVKVLATVPAWGNASSFVMTNALAGGASVLSVGPLPLAGCPSCVSQASHVVMHGLDTVVAPAFRFIADMGDNDVHYGFPGGVSGRWLSGLYTSHVRPFFRGDLASMVVPQA